MAQKKQKFITPVGVAVFPHLNEVDVYQPVDKQGRPNGAQKRRYITRVRYEASDLQKLQAFLKAKAKELLPDVDEPKLPIKKSKVKDKDGKVTGYEYLLEATSGEKFRPAAFDTKNNKLPEGVTVGGGSKIKLDLSINDYTGFGGGINLYINAVQVLELVEGGRSGKSNFDEAEGFEYSDDEGGEAPAFGATDAPAAAGKDEFAF